MAIIHGSAEYPEKKKKKGARLPPKRGQIKMKIISAFFKMVARVGAKAAGRVMTRKNLNEIHPQQPNGSLHMYL